MQNKQQNMLAVVVVIAIVAVGLVAMPGLSQQVSADPDSKFKAYVSEDGNTFSASTCSKDDGGCKDFKETQGNNVNKNARENCDRTSDERCKQVK